MTKEALRKIYLDKRNSLSEATYLQYNNQICHQFFATVDLSFVQVLQTFLPIAKTKEPDTWLIIDRIKRDFSHVQVSVPRINNQTALIDNFYFEGPQQLEKNMWGIPEPKQGIPTPTDKIDIVLVPLLAFDRKGNRVGYGRGFYDKFLATCRPECRKIGLSFFPAESTITGVQDYDIPLDLAVTPDETIVLRS